MIEKTSLLRKYGFYRVLDLLSSDGSKISIMQFTKNLNETDYYNMFLRVKKELLQKNIISIEYDSIKKHKAINLTNNGIILKLRLKEIIDQLDNPYGKTVDAKKYIEFVRADQL